MSCWAAHMRFTLPTFEPLTSAARANHGVMSAAASSEQPAVALASAHVVASCDASTGDGASVLSVPRLVIKAATLVNEVQRLRQELAGTSGELDSCRAAKSALETDLRQLKAVARQQALTAQEDAARLQAQVCTPVCKRKLKAGASGRPHTLSWAKAFRWTQRWWHARSSSALLSSCVQRGRHC